MTESKEKINSVGVEPIFGLYGEIRVPGDKSISHRAVILGAIGEGVTEVHGALLGEDNLSTIEAIGNMGIEVITPGTTSERLLIKGKGLRGLSEPNTIIDAGNSGTTSRLLMGLLSGQSFNSVITGDDSLKGRPMGRIIKPLELMGANIKGRVAEGVAVMGDKVTLPVTITGSKLHGIDYSTPVPSAQLKSAILLAGLYAEGSTTVTESHLSRDHSERMLAQFGARIDASGLTTTIHPGSALKGSHIKVPGDISSAAFLMVAALITPRSELIIKEVGLNPTRVGIIDILKRMGASIEIINFNEAFEPTGDIVVRSSSLHGIDISGSELLPAIDEFPVICVAAAFAKGVTDISGAGELRVKESDRIKAVADGLARIGVRVKEKEDGLLVEGVLHEVIEGKVSGSPVEVPEIETYLDHRIAMAFGVAGLALPGGISIKNPECIDISFPRFFELIKGVSN